MRTLRHAAVMLFLAYLLSAITPPVPDFETRLARFHEHYDKFLRSYLGCAKGATFIEQCEQKLGTFDYSEFNRAAREARELFGLEKGR